MKPLAPSLTALLQPKSPLR